MIKGIGTDIVETNRIAKSFNQIALKILSENELVLFNSYPSSKRQIEFLAGRFAAKEAIIKAYDKPLMMRDIDISYQASKPVSNIPKVQVSISHELNYAIAFAIYEL